MFTENEMQIDTTSWKGPRPKIAALPMSKNMLNEVFSFLPGCTILHKIALLSKPVRDLLTVLAPFAANRLITLKLESPLDCKVEIPKGLPKVNGKKGNNCKPLEANLFVIEKFLRFTKNLRV